MQVNFGCDLHVSSPVCLTDVVYVLLHGGGHVKVTSDIDIDSMKNKHSLISGFVFIIAYLSFAVFILEKLDNVL